MMEWHPDNSNLDQVANNALNVKDNIDPVCCETPDIHIYADIGHWRRKNQASAWIWCSRCGAYDHLDGLLINERWKNCTEIERDDLTSPPRRLEKKKAIVDKHYNEFRKAAV